MNKIKIYQGEIFKDHRGNLTHFNEFNFTGVKRYYTIFHENTEVVRAWHGHQFECKWFQVLSGGFVLSFVRPDNWENPSADLPVETFRLHADNPQLLFLPQGYANCIRATEPNSTLLVYTGKELEEAKLDSWRWTPDTWGGDKIR